MPLKIGLKPGEKLFIGGAVIQNGDTATELVVLNDTPLLREKEILTEAAANSHCRQIQLCVQLMYMDFPSLVRYQKSYAALVDTLLQNVPSAAVHVAEINHHLAFGEYYKALKAAQRLVQYEEELIQHAQSA